MCVNDLRLESIDRSEADIRPDARERREAQGIVRPAEPVGAKVGIAGPREEMRRVKDEQLEARRGAGEDARRPAKQIVVSVCASLLGELGDHRRIAGHEGSHLDTFVGERRGQRADHVGKAAGLDRAG